MGSVAKPRHMLRAGHPGTQQLIRSLTVLAGLCNRQLWQHLRPRLRAVGWRSGKEPLFIWGGRRECWEGAPASLQPTKSCFGRAWCR